MISLVHFGPNELIKKFVNAGAYVNAQDEKGKSLLWHAVYKQNVEAVKLLLANEDIDVYASNPLDYARKNGHYEIARLIEEHIKQKEEEKNNERLNRLQQIVNASMCEVLLENYAVLERISSQEQGSSDYMRQIPKVCIEGLINDSTLKQEERQESEDTQTLSMGLKGSVSPEVKVNRE